MMAQVRQALIGWVAEQTGLPVIWVRQGDIEAPAYPYCTVELVRETRSRRSAFDGTTHVRQADSVVRVRCYQRIAAPTDAEYAFETLSALGESVQFETTRSRFYAAGVAVGEIGTLTDISSLTGNEWLSEAELELRVLHAIVTTENVPEMAEFQVDIRIDNDAGRVLDETQTYTLEE